MKKSVVIYVHGFMSGRESSKWKYLKDLPNVQAHCFEVDYKKTNIARVVRDLVSMGLDFEDPIIIGHSLGGFVTRVATNMVAFRSILINPSFNPVKTLFNGGERSLPLEFKSEYEEMTSRLPRLFGGVKNLTPEIILVEHGDTIVNHKENEWLFEFSDVHSFDDGDHSFTRLNKIGDAIEILENRPWN